jgi:hypothetical protein
MSPASMWKRSDLRDPFAIILRADDAPTVVLQTARDADEATVAFHTEQQQLTRRGVVGDLLLVHQRQARTRLREPLRSPPRAES